VPLEIGEDSVRLSHLVPAEYVNKDLRAFISETNSRRTPAAAADSGSTRIVRGGTAVAMVGGGKTYNLQGGIYCRGEALVKVSFAANGTVSINAANQETTTDGSYPFNVEGYRYV